MPNLSDPVSSRETRLGGLSFLFLAIGLVGPFFNSLALAFIHSSPTHATLDPMGIAFGIRGVFLLLALVLGIFSRRSRTGHLGLIGSGVVLGVALLLVLVLLFSHAAKPVSPASTAPTVPT